MIATLADCTGLPGRTCLFYEVAAMPEDKEQEFFPRGAIAFFAAMLAFFSAVWVLFYALMIHRH